MTSRLTKAALPGMDHVWSTNSAEPHRPPCTRFTNSQILACQPVDFVRTVLQRIADELSTIVDDDGGEA